MSGLRWPATLRARIFLILFVGLAVAYALSFTVLSIERYLTAKELMLGTLENDVATSIAVLDQLPAGERPRFAGRLGRGNYQFVLGEGQPGVPDTSRHGAEIAARIEAATGHRFPLSLETTPGDVQRLQAHLSLSDGSPLTIDIMPRGVMPVADWLPYVFIVQMALLMLCAWYAVRQATRPLGRLAEAAETLDPNRRGPALDETGPSEVAHAAAAFNAMRERIAHYLEERVQILAAISHDLQTPITRMRLRADMADDTPERDKLVRDLAEIERLVQDGIAYARSAHSSGEKATRIDLSSFIDSIAYDYQDTGKAVQVSGVVSGTVATKPHPRQFRRQRVEICRQRRDKRRARRRQDRHRRARPRAGHSGRQAGSGDEAFLPAGGVAQPRDRRRGARARHRPATLRLDRRGGAALQSPRRRACRRNRVALNEARIFRAFRMGK